ncbi:hypothetical protein [Fictibacillus phosphorivorans]|uniref:hypothetical protein n=1 Tax=Fictibacillus phosphorivorans TaxID=1221500 RepID=UPI00203A6ED9|nr:hypothetical protein [Fictibacillus phosphorivorans]MCM3718631.1 hypothetical protein [Fictibacillus phosphorivorans]MCM3776254.1 hypothetical protein [Fictibacillus phosphorivorans]
MIVAFRMLLLSGLLSVLTGIFFVTDLLKTKSVSGMGLWGYFLLFWGIATVLISFKRLPYFWLMKVLAGAGILLHGPLFLYWVLFPDGLGQELGKGNSFYGLASGLSVVCCILIIGKKGNRKISSHSISK